MSVPGSRSALILPRLSTPTAPASGYDKIYTKSDGYVYSLSSTGTEVRVTNATTRGAVDTGWVTLPLGTDWQAYGGSHRTPQYRRIDLQVHLRGLISRVNTNAPANTVIATLPSGSRPTQIEIKAGDVYTGTGTDTPMRIDVYPDGTITCPTVAINVGGFVSLGSFGYFFNDT